ncbi:MAG: hypothetical protein V4495_02465 [Pseudomonadota bacterium]
MKPLRRQGDVLKDWINELSIRLGRSVEELAKNGLMASDFGRVVEVRTPYGMTIRFDLAFYLVRPVLAQAVVFTEHSGYVEFEMVDDMVFAEITETIFRYDSEHSDYSDSAES